jgi:hypothetical protein
MFMAFKVRSGINPCIRPSKFLQSINPCISLKSKSYELIIHGFKSHEHELQLNVNIYLIGIDLQFQLQRWNRRANDYFEISDFEDPGRIFRNRHPRPLKLVFSGLIQLTNRKFYNHHLKRPGASKDSKPRLGKKGTQSPFRALSGVLWDSEAILSGGCKNSR